MEDHLNFHKNFLLSEFVSNFLNTLFEVKPYLSSSVQCNYEYTLHPGKTFDMLLDFSKDVSLICSKDTDLILLCDHLNEFTSYEWYYHKKNIFLFCDQVYCAFVDSLDDNYLKILDDFQSRLIGLDIKKTTCIVLYANKFSSNIISKKEYVQLFSLSGINVVFSDDLDVKHGNLNFEKTF
jgi:hypothetical protein